MKNNSEDEKKVLKMKKNEVLNTCASNQPGSLSSV